MTEPRPLPRGPHGLSREEVELSLRARLLQATTDAVAELGYVKTTVADVLTRAGVSRATFYRMFRDREEAFEAAYAANAELIAHVMAAELERVRAAGDDRPLARLDRVLGVYLRALRDAPALARVFLVEVYAAGPAAAAQRQASLEQFVDIVAETHRGETGVLGTLKRQRFAAGAFVGAVSAMVTNLVATGDFDRLPSLQRPLMELAAQITRDPGVSGRRSQGTEGP
jgi:AcrR family transcriptional regulator